MSDLNSDKKECQVVNEVVNREIRCALCDRRALHKGTTRQEFYNLVTDFRINCPLKTNENE